MNSFPPPPISLSFAYLMNTTGQARLPELLHLDDSVLPQVTIKDPVNAVDAPPDQVLLLQTPAQQEPVCPSTVHHLSES